MKCRTFYLIPSFHLIFHGELSFLAVLLVDIINIKTFDYYRPHVPITLAVEKSGTSGMGLVFDYVNEYMGGEKKSKWVRIPVLHRYIY